MHGYDGRFGPNQWPAVWAHRPGRRKHIVSAIFLLLLTTGVLAASVVSLANGEYGAGVLSALFFTALLLVLGIGVLVRFPGKRKDLSVLRSGSVPGVDHVGLVIPYRRSLAVGYASVPVVFFFLLAPFTAAATMELWQQAREGSIGLTLAVQWLFYLIGSILSAWTIVHMVRRRLTRGHLILTPAGVRHRSWSFDSFFSWDGVLFVQAAEADGPLIEMAVYRQSDSRFERTSKVWKQEELSFAPHMAVRGQWLSIDPALAYWALRYYHEHPDARAELGDGRGMARLRAGALV